MHGVADRSDLVNWIVVEQEYIGHGLLAGKFSECSNLQRSRRFTVLVLKDVDGSVKWLGSVCGSVLKWRRTKGNGLRRKPVQVVWSFRKPNRKPNHVTAVRNTKKRFSHGHQIFIDGHTSNTSYSVRHSFCTMTSDSRKHMPPRGQVDFDYEWSRPRLRKLLSKM